MRLCLILILFATNLFAQQKLYYFSGSDWCAPCIKFKKEFIDVNPFQSWVKENNIDFEILDFPQRKKGLSKSYLKKCDSLASLYNKEGSFPKLIAVSDNSYKTFNHKAGSERLMLDLNIQFPKKLKDTKPKMGSVFNLEISGGDSRDLEEAWKTIDLFKSEVSSWDSSSITNKIIVNAGVKPVKVPLRYFWMLKRCVTLSNLTQGAFDITIKPALKIWDWKKGNIPNQDVIDSVKTLIGSNKIVLNASDTSIYLPINGMALDFGAFGKGMAADQIIAEWKVDQEIKSGVVDAGGDILVYGEEKEIVIPNPVKTNEVLYSLKIKDQAVVTSGDYVRYFEKDGKKYSHILDPRTCKPVSNNISSVTVIGPLASVADGLATAITVLGVEVGVDLINQVDGYEVIIVKSSGEDFTSEGVSFYKN